MSSLLHDPWSHNVGAIWHSLREHVFNPYRPELHYMRGPGPKWRSKHGGL
jgi:hypothetical protein